ATNPSGQ
nr:RecName: Full=30 kDa cell wall protein [Daucus carota]